MHYESLQMAVILNNEDEIGLVEIPDLFLCSKRFTEKILCNQGKALFKIVKQCLIFSMPFFRSWIHRNEKSLVAKQPLVVLKNRDSINHILK